MSEYPPKIYSENTEPAIRGRPGKPKGARRCATMLAGPASREAEQRQKSGQSKQPPTGAETNLLAELTGAEKKLLAEFCERTDARHPAPRVTVDHRPPNLVIAPAEGETKTAAAARLPAFGTTSTDFS